MKEILVHTATAEKGKLTVTYNVSPELEKYFSSLRAYEVEYNEDISASPESVLVIPFICNIIPIVWLTDATLIVPQLDKEFYEGLPGVLKGYKDMSPMLEFKGDIKVDQLVDNSYLPTEEVGALFSGGVDAFATLIAHVEEKPSLITLWGADIKLDDTDGWNIVKQHAEDTCNVFELPAPILVRSNFRSIVNEWNLDELVSASGDGWWYGYQHGIALLGHAAPLAYLKRWKTLYIASSFTADNKTICASDPTIDNKLHLVSTRVWHDQYEYHRQQKVQHIVEYCRAADKTLILRVCWVTAGGTNCCKCEKCQRTIFSLLAEGENPADYGFPNWRQGIEGTELSTPRFCRYTPRFRKVYAQIQARFHETQAYRTDSTINWFYNVDFFQEPTMNDLIADQQRELAETVQSLLINHNNLAGQLSLIQEQNELISLQLNKGKIFRRYLYCRLMSELTFGRRRKKYKREKYHLKSLLKRISNQQAFSPPPPLVSHTEPSQKTEAAVKQAWDLTQEEADALSYYPNQTKKDIDTIRKELEYLCQPGNGAWDDNTTISHYFQFGLDRAGINILDYIFQKKYDIARDSEQPAYASILNHKGCTAALLRQAGLSVSCALGRINSEGIICKPGHKGNIRLTDFLKQSPGQSYFCKPIDGFQSQNCFKIEYKNGILLNGQEYSTEEAFKKLANLSIEPYIKQHPLMDELYPHAVNTIRVVTIARNNTITVYATVIMIGSEGSHVSGIPSGGIVVEVNEQGLLCSLGHKSKKPGFGKFTHHPDTGIKFDGFQLPMWKEVIKLAKDAHTVLSDIPTIGWDIAITETGPIIVEANQNWGCCVFEYVSDTHKPLFDKYFSHLL